MTIYFALKGGKGVSLSLEVVASHVALNGTPDTGDFMSDHCGVLSQVNINSSKGGKPKHGRFPHADALD